ncbi:Asp23/Gls24 family envelope stress response protein [Rubrobacter taiwanensis]|jgi:uncharacterized alkaline shock family protein YloU|uniref:Asp23/Gls24 family envelope stress response protein n=1 Tax=Rubrobacter taiwanensis TaxID=185139 RepID=A0A4R1BS57_9ACTN|nr:Asp23/Gls24 family envelope stress response protein [Rubrobacter taiwanensis]TCJ20481.1 Asp23/Gls24 family envelope stress response protein [Rubrobacter taiwanensis]
MSEQRQQEQQRQQQARQRSPLQSERGATRVEDSVVAKIAGMAAQEVEGVRMGGGASRALGGIVDSVTGGGGGQTRGVSVEVGEVETAIDLTMAVDYGKSIPQLTESVRKNVIQRVENLVGLNVKEVNITVNDVILPQQEREEEERERRELESAQEEPRVR